MSDKQTCILLFHLSTGDNFTVYGMVMHFQQLYDKVIIFSLDRNIETVTQLYEQYSNIEIIKLDKNHNLCCVPNDDINKQIEQHPESNVIRTGMMGDFQCTTEFYITFYKQAGLNYDIRYNYENINRNYEHELNLYNRFVAKYGTKYIFTHDHRNLFYKHGDCRKNVIVESKIDLPIFHPNINYYENDPDNKYYNNWNEEFYVTNILDYCTIIENASELHLSDSSFSCLCPYLNLKATTKKVFSNLNYKTYHKCFNEWQNIYR